MTFRTDLQPAYVVHSRAYRDTSLLLEVFTAEYGRISLVARGARQSGKRGAGASLLQPFQPLLISFSGRSELKTLSRVEAAGMAIGLRGERLFSGLYLNELIVRLLHPHDPHPQIFANYGEVLRQLVDVEFLEDSLRGFELLLLDSLGYKLVLDEDCVSGAAVLEKCWYRYFPGQGFQLETDPSQADAATLERLYRGRDLLSMARGDFENATRPVAKRLLREVLAEYLGGKPLNSRELFRGLGESEASSFATAAMRRR